MLYELWNNDKTKAGSYIVYQNGSVKYQVLKTVQTLIDKNEIDH